MEDNKEMLDSVNNVENQYTEELDFSNMAEELEKAKEEAQEIHETPVYDAAPVESYEDVAAKLEEELNSAPQAPVEEESGNTFVDEIRNAELNEAPAPQYEAAPVESYADSPVEQPVEVSETPAYEAAPVESYTDTPSNSESAPAEDPVYEVAHVETLEEVQKRDADKKPDVIPVYDAAPVDNSGPKERVKSYENPVAVIKFNTEPEEEQEYIDPKTIQLDFKGNKNLWFVIGLGVLLLIAVFALPLFL